MPVYSVTVTPSNASIKTGQYYYWAEATVNASSNCSKEVEWYSDNPNIAAVNESNGFIYGVSVGKTRIYARSKVDSTKKDYICIEVTKGPIPVQSVDLDIRSAKIEKGKYFILTATVSPTNATNKKICWSSEKPSIARVEDGKVTGISEGGTYVFATATDGSDEYDACYVTVTNNTLVNSITLNYSSYTLSANGTVRLYATVYPDDAKCKCVKWSSNETSVATVNPDTGLVIAQGKGTARIRATVTDGSGKYAECVVTVKAPKSVTGITLSPTNLTMNVCDVKCLCASVTPSDATNQTVSFCSSNENVATVGLYSGKITAKKAGTTTITATTADGGYQASCTVKVYIDTVTIMEDGAFNKVVFKKSGKVWRCINHDMIFDKDPNMMMRLITRSNYNFFTHYDETDLLKCDTTPKEYTDDEIKLLYAIDPYGVADYVKRYADKKCDLEDGVKYKDSKFKVLFKRNPQYFKRTIEGTWYPVSHYEEINDVVSESETLFGGHKIWDGYTNIEIVEAIVTIMDIVITVVTTAPGFKRILDGHRNLETVTKIFSFIANCAGSGFNSSVIDEFVEVAFKATSLSWAYDMVSLYGSLTELVSDFETGNNFYPQILEHCITDIDYRIYVELQNGTKYQLEEIRELMSTN